MLLFRVIGGGVFVICAILGCAAQVYLLAAVLCGSSATVCPFPVSTVGGLLLWVVCALQSSPCPTCVLSKPVVFAQALCIGTVPSQGNRQTVSSKLQWVIHKYKRRKTNQRTGTRKTAYITVHLDTKHRLFVQFLPTKRQLTNALILTGIAMFM